MCKFDAWNKVQDNCITLVGSESYLLYKGSKIIDTFVYAQSLNRLTLLIINSLFKIQVGVVENESSSGKLKRIYGNESSSEKLERIVGTK